MKNGGDAQHVKQSKEAWYKNPWLLLVIFIPLAAVIASFNMLRLALQGVDSTPHTFWSKQGFEIIGEEKLLSEANALGLSGQLTFDPLIGEVTATITLPNNRLSDGQSSQNSSTVSTSTEHSVSTHHPIQQIRSNHLELELLMAHATLKDRDQSITLSTLLPPSPSNQLSNLSPQDNLNDNTVRVKGNLVQKISGKYHLYLTAKPKPSNASENTAHQEDASWSWMLKGLLNEQADDSDSQQNRQSKPFTLSLTPK